MIEPTAEMVFAAWDALPVSAQESELVDLADMKTVLDAAFALIERDYALVDRKSVDRPRCGYLHEVRCEFPEGHPGGHGRVRIEEFS